MCSRLRVSVCSSGLRWRCGGGWCMPLMELRWLLGLIKSTGTAVWLRLGEPQQIRPVRKRGRDLHLYLEHVWGETFQSHNTIGCVIYYIYYKCIGVFPLHSSSSGAVLPLFTSSTAISCAIEFIMLNDAFIICWRVYYRWPLLRSSHLFLSLKRYVRRILTAK